RIDLLVAGQPKQLLRLGTRHQLADQELLDFDGDERLDPSAPLAGEDLLDAGDGDHVGEPEPLREQALIEHVAGRAPLQLGCDRGEVVVERGREIVLPRRRVRRGRESPGRASAAARRQWPEERRHEQGATERPWDSPHVGAVYPRTRSRSMPPTEPSAGGGEFPWPIVHSVMTRRFVPTLAFAIPLLGLAGCDGKPDEDLPPAARRQAPPVETPSEKPATEEPPKKKLTEVRMDPVPAPTAAQFRKGVPARPGMSPD